MSKSYYSLGLMSGTSMDGVDASVIQTDGSRNMKYFINIINIQTKFIRNILI